MATDIHSVDPRLAKALSNPVRARALDLIAAGERSPKAIATELGLDVRSVAYHVRVLKKLDCIELVETQPPIHAARADDVMWHFAVRTNDIDRVLEAVAHAGYEVTRPTKQLDLMDTARDQPFSIRVAFFRGPDGEEIELFEDQQGHT